MESGRQLVFGEFRLDPVQQHLRQGEETIPLQPRPFAVLQYLAEHPGQTVTKEALLQEVWEGTYVTKAALKVCIRAIREALGETATSPHYIETVGREGYRFRGDGAGLNAAAATAEAFAGRPVIVGRETEVARLHHQLRQALDGERQLVFVTGEAGIGKTAVVDLFAEQVQAKGRVTVGRGQCIEQYGEGEAYLPLLEALGRLCQEAGGEQLIRLLRQHAPMWLMQLPGVVEEAERKELQAQVQGASRERMLREMAEVLEVVTARRPLLLLLEDLHWSDPSTIELLSYIAQRRERARLMIVGTYRPVDAVLSQHPLKGVKQELQAKGLCEELRVELLQETDVTTYVGERLGDSKLADELGQVVHQRTEGNALFMVNVVEALISQGIISKTNGHWELKQQSEEIDTSETLQQLIEKQIERLSSEEQRILEVASLAGVEFPVAAVAAALKQDIDEIEDVCEELAGRGHFLREEEIAEWPDGTVSGRYAFQHALYREVLSRRVGGARRVRLHRQIGERLEAGYKNHTEEVAAELAVHFERGRDPERAVRYLQQAADAAFRQFAYMKAVNHSTKAIAVLASLPEGGERTEQELALQMTLAPALMAIHGYADSEAERAYTRALALCRQLEDPPQLLMVLPAMRGIYYVRADYARTQELAEEYLPLAERMPLLPFLIWAQYGLGETLMYAGQLQQGRVHLEQGSALYDPDEVRAAGYYPVHDPGVACLTETGWALWLQGYPDQAVQKVQEGLTLAQDIADPLSLALAYNGCVGLHQFRREGQAVLTEVKTALGHAQEYGFPYWRAWGLILEGWAMAAQGQQPGVEQITAAVAAYREIRARHHLSHFLALLGEAYLCTGQVEEGGRVISEALTLVNQTGERYYKAELYRLKGELLLMQASKKEKAKRKRQNTDVAGEAEACFQKALEVSRHQEAKSLELRAATSLARLWQQQGKTAEAHTLLTEIYNWFTEGFDTADLKDAKALLGELA